MNQDIQTPAQHVESDRVARDHAGVAASRPVHVLTLLVSMPIIGALAALIVWMLGGSGWHIILSVLASWLLIQMIYAGQVAYYAVRAGRMPVQPASNGRRIQARD